MPGNDNRLPQTPLNLFLGWIHSHEYGLHRSFLDCTRQKYASSSHNGGTASGTSAPALIVAEKLGKASYPTALCV